jgi:hypothetical protein
MQNDNGDEFAAERLHPKGTYWCCRPIGVRGGSLAERPVYLEKPTFADLVEEIRARRLRSFAVAAGDRGKIKIDRLHRKVANWRSRPLIGPKAPCKPSLGGSLRLQLR